MNSILIVYASEHGSTAEICDSMKNYLNKANCFVETMPVVAQTVDLSKYDMIIIGSEIYGGVPLYTIKEFIDLNRDSLETKNVSVFAVSGLMTSKYKSWKEKSTTFADSVSNGLPSKHKAVFAGRIPDMGWLQNGIGFRLICGMKPGDYRDWNKIKKWTISLVE